MKRQMRTIVSFIKKYNAQDHKIDKRYIRETEFYYGTMSEFEKTGKSALLRHMQAKLQDLNAEINALAVQIDSTPGEWDADIVNAGLCLDSWNHKLVFELISEAA
ncbi:hypothetical protein [Photobacterium toruni]|uniref:Uncharacterized protein n=1 Tax=Photobacterium toruni TaxID=1935446 RepID=A0A1T4UJ23_9GAMM|nr:hypothetical protein [Photobacterium toruni]SKA52735.1 hypothetical protein CZ814_03338 [Photobacterium toruni]